MRERAAVHFVGIGGIGMSALARLLLARGERVSGSSDRPSPLLERLAAEGATIALGHAPENLGDARCVVVSAAIADENPELVAARARNCEIVRRGTLLARLAAEHRALAIAGTHGKTTTTAMVAAILEGAGLDPTVAVGGELLGSERNARTGAGPYFVLEADESDRSFLELQPSYALVGNVEDDHVASPAEFAALLADFERFLASVPAEGAVAIGIDEPHGAELARRPRPARSRTFGFAAGAEVRACERAHAGFGSSATIERMGARLGRLQLQIPGEHNLRNALGAVALAGELEIPFGTCADALAAFRGVHRRFEILARTARMTVVDDYAHHPTAVAATIAAARAAGLAPLVVAFEPHRYTRTAYLAPAFARALAAADRVVLTDIYAASEPPLAGIDARSIGRPLEAAGVPVAYVASPADLPEHLLAHTPRGALVLMLGAGSISQAAHALAGELAPLAV
ncbi:MAG: UDP-N-acetylmuramate--L-alanine ligase [Vulcanimicrobiaceae bacterium]